MDWYNKKKEYKCEQWFLKHMMIVCNYRSKLIIRKSFFGPVTAELFTQ